MRPGAEEEIVLELEILDGEGRVIRSFSSREQQRDPIDPGPDPKELGFPESEPLPVEAGMNRWVWDLRRDPVGRPEELAVPYPRAKSYRVAPGTYRVRLTLGEQAVERSLEVVADPRVPLPAAAFAAQQELIESIWRRVDGIHAAVRRLAAVRRQVEDLVARTAHLEAAATLAAAGDQLVERIDAWEERLVQPRHETFQDVINFPNRLNAQYLFLLEAVDTSDLPVTAGARRRFADLEAQWQEHEAEMRQILDLHVPAFNLLVEENRVPAVIVPGNLDPLRRNP